jgi:hypothetical protein
MKSTTSSGAALQRHTEDAHLEIDNNQQGRRFRLPSHLQLLHKPAANDLINRRFGDRGRNRLAVPAMNISMPQKSFRTLQKAPWMIVGIFGICIRNCDAFGRLLEHGKAHRDCACSGTPLTFHSQRQARREQPR